jgi:hypothetical protein
MEIKIWKLNIEDAINNKIKIIIIKIKYWEGK